MANPYCREIKIYNTEKYLTEKLKIKLEPNLNNFSLIGKDFKVYITSTSWLRFLKQHPILLRFGEADTIHVFHRHISAVF